MQKIKWTLRLSRTKGDVVQTFQERKRLTVVILVRRRDHATGETAHAERRRTRRKGGPEKGGPRRTRGGPR
ncbi:hypothetical protein GCM10010151_45720 [Actinoallomurus spadix]|uniref:Transposase n=1 Tax=Actinoallomurus spadix TaxID=79912 RepID=A0ABP3GS56_9ACTN